MLLVLCKGWRTPKTLVSGLTLYEFICRQKLYNIRDKKKPVSFRLSLCASTILCKSVGLNETERTFCFDYAIENEVGYRQAHNGI